MTKRHRHADMIIAKAENTDLVVFIENINTGNWWEVTHDTLFNSHQNFFLCLPQHKDACLHWLNGGAIQMQSDNDWIDVTSPDFPWKADNIFTYDYTTLRIKPRKEKLYIAIKTDKYEHLGGCREVRICSHAFVSKEDAESYLDLSDSQLVEIEVEV